MTDPPAGKDIYVSSWNELADHLFQGGWRQDIERFRPSRAYRGSSNCAYDLTTSLARLERGEREIEGAMLRAFRKYAPLEVVPGGSVWNWLALAQHHGLATRLLDWSYSPYVAMHFATENMRRYGVDGAIWCIDYRQTNELLPQRLKEILSEEGSDVFTADMLHQAAATLDELDELSDTDFVAFFEPPSFDNRIVNQYALFSLLSDPRMSLQDWLQEHPDTYYRVIIPAELKWEVRDKLDQANVTERVLFPGLDGLSHWLNRYYMTRQAAESLVDADDDGSQHVLAERGQI